jgi:hypothetical protein
VNVMLGTDSGDRDALDTLLNVAELAATNR